MVAENAQERGSRTRAKVFLSYARSDPNADVVHAVHTAFAGEHDVFCDVVTLSGGALWASEIDAKIAEADYFVVFLSAEAARSDMVIEETRRARNRQKETGRPRIVPIPFGYDADNLGVDLSASVQRSHLIPWQTPEDTADLIAELRRVFSGESAVATSGIAPALSRYLVSTARTERIRETFVPPPGVEKAREAIRAGRVLWITGPPGAGKHFLASALACELDQPAFELRRTLSWAYILQNQPARSVMVLPDALAPERAGTSDYQAELGKLGQICDTGNTVLLTCSDEEYATRHTDLRDAGFTAEKLACYRLTGDMYSLSLRAEIVRNLVTQNQAAGIVSLEQRQWLEPILDAPQLPWKDWSLGELESFVTRSLPTTKSSSDVRQLLDRRVTIQDQVHAWFLGLDEAARSLLLTLLLFPEATSEQIWTRFRAILAELEALRLVPQIAIPTLGVCRARCAPYVTQTGDLEIADSDDASAIARELAVSWREYVLELKRLLAGWALPPAGQDPAVTRAGGDESAAVRQQLARLLGELMKVRLEDVQPLLETFATFEKSIVRRAAAEAIVHAFGSEDGARHCRRLLRTWEADRWGESAAARKREVAADACWRIALLHKEPAAYDFALEQLQRHARDVPRVRAVVAHGIGRIVSGDTFDELQPLMTRLARDPDTIVRRRTGVALSELARRAPEKADAVFADWVASKDARRLWTAAYALLVSPRLGRGERDKLHTLMQLDPRAFAEALLSSITSGDEVKDMARTQDATRNLLRLIADAQSKAVCATALGRHWAEDPNAGADLCERLGRLAVVSVDELLVEACRERLFDTVWFAPVQELVLADVDAGGTRRQVATRAVGATISGLTDDLRPRMAEGWEETPERFERFLRWLRTDLGDAGRRAVVLLRLFVLESLFARPEEWVKWTASWLRSSETRDEASDALHEIMAAPKGWSRLVTPLTNGYWSSRSDVWLILGVLEAPSSISIREVAFDLLLEEDPRRFVDAAIEETQDFETVRGDVLKALSAVARRKGAAVAAAVRRAVPTTDTRRLRRLIRDFGEAHGPLTRVAEDLWLTRLWLSVREFFSYLRL